MEYQARRGKTDDYEPREAKGDEESRCSEICKRKSISGNNQEENSSNELRLVAAVKAAKWWLGCGLMEPQAEEAKWQLINNVNNISNNNNETKQ